MWAHGSRSGAGRWLLALALLLLLSPLSSWAEPSARERAALEALAQAQVALIQAKAKLIEAEKALAASREESMVLSEQLAALKIEVEKLKGEYAMRLKESEALKTQSDALATSLKASQADLLTAERWAAGFGVAAVLAVLGWIFL